MVTQNQYGTMTENATETLLERERKVRGLNYRELGDLLGVERQSAYRYCRGERRPERGKDGDGPAERLERWSGGAIHAGNFDKPAATPKRRRR